jgi:hypothetical protein
MDDEATHLPHRRAVIAAGAALATTPALAASGAGEVLELRQYTCHPGGRDRLISLFEREFIAPQEALGAHVLGTFRDRDDPDRFVWLRGFASFEARPQALTSFYGGPVWAANRNAANATMLDSDNVLLLKPATAGAGLRTGRAGSGEILAFIHYLDDGQSAPFAAYFASLRPLIEADGGEILGAYVSEARPNNFPRLPVREREHVFVWLVRPRDGSAVFLDRRRARTGWREAAVEALLPAFMRKPETLRLDATSASPLA